MEKKHFMALVLGVVGGLLFGLGMCMCLLPEWKMFYEGIYLAVIGVIILFIMMTAYRRMSGKAPIKVKKKVLLKVLYGIFSSLVLGAGMAMALELEGMMLWGIAVGVLGIVMLLFLIPMCIGFKNHKEHESHE